VWHKYNDNSQKSFQNSCRKETENCKVNLETEKDPEMTDCMNSTSEQKSEILRKSNRPKKQPATKNSNFLW
jgi:hypothetical protein